MIADHVFSARPSLKRLIVMMVLLVGCSIPFRAHAFLATWGTTVSHLGHVPIEKKHDVEPSTRVGVQIGYGYHHVGLFWLDLWTWGGKYCLYDGNSFWEISDSKAADLLGVNEEQLSRPILYRFPPLLLILVAFLLYVIFGPTPRKAHQTEGLGEKELVGAHPLVSSTSSNGEECAKHTFRFRAPGTAKTVHLVGEFNRWHKGATPMALGSDGSWSIQMSLPKRRWRYKYVLDSRDWVADRTVDIELDEAGNENSVVDLA